MATQSLVVSRDAAILGQLRPLLNEAGMEMEVCRDFPRAVQAMRSRKFDAVIVDCHEEAGGLDLLAEMRKQRDYQKTIMVGIVGDSALMGAAFERGATFVLGLPLPMEDARRIFQIVKGVITRAVRRFLRLPVESLAYVTLDDSQTATILNICQGGVAVQCMEVLHYAQMLRVSFVLPRASRGIEGMGQVMWVDPSGRAGIEFRNISAEAQAHLDEWVLQYSHEQLAMPPEAKTHAAASEPAPESRPETNPQNSEEASIEKPRNWRWPWQR